MKPRPFLLALALLLALAALLLLRPLAPAGLASHPRPARSYGEALARIAVLRALDGPEIAPECRTLLLTHGARTGRVVLVFHGLTNCPEQFHALGDRLFECGANVFVPRVPRHGLADRMTGELAQLDARELRAFTDAATDIARGLGDSVTVVGLSVGAVMAAWAGQERADVDRAVAIAPLLGVTQARGWLTPAATRLVLALPNVFPWWDSERKQHLLGPKHVYPRFSTRAVGQTLLLGGAVLHDARRRPPAARALVVVTVGHDVAVDNGMCAELVRAWQAHGARDLTAYEFPESLRLNHDIVDPEQAGGNPRLTYPVLEDLILR
ncbi:MAG: alpha/beta hydrolase [Candidatus Eisenbacteria bacterium]|nr:alpha/beta hydrolase [Candidatus Eisenbacteria bacterium]